MKVLLCSVLMIGIISSLESTTTRLRSMGNLQIVIDDNTNKIDLFNFGNNPCGLFSNEDTNIVDLDVLYGEETSKIDTIECDTTYITYGNAVPFELLEFIPIFDKDVFQYIPLLTAPRNRLFYVKRNKSERPDLWGNVPKKQAMGFGVTYGKLEQKFTDGKDNIGGPALSFIYDRIQSPNLHLGFEGEYISTGYNGDEEFEKASLSNFKLTPAVSFIPSHFITIGAKIDYHHPSCSFGTGENESVYSGNAFNFSLSTIANINNYFETGALIGYKILNAKEENENFSLKGFDVRLKPRVSLPNLPLALGGLIDIREIGMLDESENGDTLYHNKYTKMTFGGGPVLEIQYLLIGIEYIYSTLTLKERFLVIDTTETSISTVRLGGEIKPVSFLNLRGGYEYVKEKERKQDAGEIVSRTIGTGFGVPLKKFVFDVSYNRIVIEEMEIEKIIEDNLYMVSIRYIY